MMPDAHSQHERELEYENMRLECQRLRRGIADHEEFLGLIHQTRMFDIWREHKKGYRKLGVGK
jgi:hypothetical protein